MDALLEDSQKTLEEKNLIKAFYEKLMLLPGTSSVIEKRKNAFKILEKGFPTKKSEFWHYTDLRRLLTGLSCISRDLSIKKIDSFLSGSHVLSIENGHSVIPNIPEILGVSITPLRCRLEEGEAVLQFHGDNDFIGALNSSFVSDGFCLEFADGCVSDSPIELQTFQGGGQEHVRFCLRMGDNVKAHIVERHVKKQDSFSSSVCDLRIRDYCDVTWIILHDSDEDASCLSALNAEVGENSKLSVVLFNTGAKIMRQELRIRMSGEHSSFRFMGMNLLSGGHSDVSMVLDHAPPHTFSRQLVRNVVTQKSQGVFQGQINVHQNAQKTDAKMSCNTLLLSDEAAFFAKPELEVFADDVTCGHGATVVDINLEALFYLMARGIAQKEARELLVKAFIMDIVQEIDDKNSIDALRLRVDSWVNTYI